MGGFGGGEWPKRTPDDIQTQNLAADSSMQQELLWLKDAFCKSGNLPDLLTEIAQGKTEPTADQKAQLRQFIERVQGWTWAVMHYHRLI